MNDSEFDFLIGEAVLPLATRFSPQAVVLTCGADCLRGDPLSTMDLSNVALWDAAKRLTELSPAAVVLGGGGYNPWIVARAWAGLWARLCGFMMPDRLPRDGRRLLAGLKCDLVDDEDMRPEWTDTLVDVGNPGPIREELNAIARRALA